MNGHFYFSMFWQGSSGMNAEDSIERQISCGTNYLSVNPMVPWHGRFYFHITEII